MEQYIKPAHATVPLMAFQQIKKIKSSMSISILITSVVDTGDKSLHMHNSECRVFIKIQKGFNNSIRAGRDAEYWKKRESKISRPCIFKGAQA